MAAAAGVGSAVGGIIGGMATFYGAKKSANVAKKGLRLQRQLSEYSEGAREAVSDTVKAEAELAGKILTAGEQARLNVLTSLGQPGTYGPGPGSTSGPISLELLKPAGLESLYYDPTEGVLTSGAQLLKTGEVKGADVALGKKPKWKGYREWSTTAGIGLDPVALANTVKSTPGFRMVSRMVAEAEQLMNREGPLWNQLNNSIVGGIYESNAAFQKQAMEQLARSIARGGTARRAGLQMVQAFQIQEQINRTRTGQLWQAKMNLEEWRTNYAQDVISYSQAWVNNHAGIRDAFTNALQNLQTFWSSTLAPTLVGATTAAQSATSQGILGASQGLMEATKIRGNVISGAVEGLVGAGKQITSGIIDYMKTSEESTPEGSEPEWY